MIRIMLADDHTILRQGLSYLLRREPDFEIVAEAENGEVAVELAEKHRPDVIIMDAAMPAMNGIEATRQITQKHRSMKVIALTVHSDENYLGGMLRAGAAGYLLKACAADQLVEAVRSVVAGNGYVSPEVAPLILKAFAAANSGSPASISEKELTPRERLVLQSIAEGISDKEIASKIGVSYKTAQRCRDELMRKLGLYTVAELTKYAVRHGVSQLDH